MMVTVPARRRFFPLPCQPPRGWKYTLRSRPLSSVIRRVSRQLSHDWQLWEPCVCAKGQESPSQGPMSMLVPLFSGKR